MTLIRWIKKHLLAWVRDGRPDYDHCTRHGRLWGLALLATLWASSANGATIVSGHPRIFGPTDSLDVYRAKTNAVGQPMYDLWQDLDAAYSALSASTTATAKSIRTLHYLFADSTTRAATKTNFRDIVDAMISSPTWSGSEDAYAGTYPEVIAYDCLFWHMKPSQRRSMRDKFYAKIGAGPNWTQLAETYNFLSYHGTAIFACAGDSSAYNARFSAAADSLIANYEKVCDCLDYVDPYGGSSDYVFKKKGRQLFDIWMIRNLVVGYSGPVAASAFAETGARALLHKIRPDYVQGGTGTKWSTADPWPGKWNTSGQAIAELTGFAGSRMGDRYAWAMAKALYDADYDSRVSSNSQTRYTLPLVWNPTGFSSTTLADIPNNLYIEGRGWLLGRQGWDLSQTSTNVSFQVFQQYKLLDDPLTALNWTVRKGTDNLVWFTDERVGDYDDNQKLWGLHALSVNSVLISRADTPHILGVDGGPAVFPDVGRATGDTTCTTPPGFTFRDVMGGQISPSASDVGNPCDHVIYTTRSQTKTRGGPSAGTLGHADNGTAMRIAGDVSLAYPPEVASEVWRAWHCLGYEWFVVWDRQVVVSGNVSVKSLLHVASRAASGDSPRLDGAIVVLRGAGSVNPDSMGVDANGHATVADPQGGIYKSTNSTVGWWENGSARGAFYPVFIGTTNGEIGHVKLIGGPAVGGDVSRDGTNHWKQDKYPCSGTYAAHGSFEFFEEEHNANRVSGSYVYPGTCTAMACGRFPVSLGTSYNFVPSATTIRYRVRPNDNASAAREGNGRGLCDWRYELRIDSPVGTADEIYAVRVGSAVGMGTAPAAIYKWKSADMAALGIPLAAGGYAEVVIPSPDTQAYAASMTWTNPLPSTQDATVYAFGLTPSTNYNILHDAVAFSSAVADTEGVVSWSHTANGVTTITLEQAASATGGNSDRWRRWGDE